MQTTKNALSAKKHAVKIFLITVFSLSYFRAEAEEDAIGQMVCQGTAKYCTP